MFAVKGKNYGVLYNQASSIAFNVTSSYWSALKNSWFLGFLLVTTLRADSVIKLVWDLITELDQAVRAVHSCNSWFIIIMSQASSLLHASKKVLCSLAVMKQFTVVSHLFPTPSKVFLCRKSYQLLAMYMYMYFSNDKTIHSRFSSGFQFQYAEKYTIYWEYITIFSTIKHFTAISHLVPGLCQDFFVLNSLPVTGHICLFLAQCTWTITPFGYLTKLGSEKFLLHTPQLLKYKHIFWWMDTFSGEANLSFLILPPS